LHDFWCDENLQVESVVESEQVCCFETTGKLEWRMNQKSWQSAELKRPSKEILRFSELNEINFQAIVMIRLSFQRIFADVSIICADELR
jgi:hypothetical protein